MPPSTTPSPAVPQDVQPARPKTLTNWDALNKAKIKPITIYCQLYQLVRGSTYRDLSCHTRLPLKADVLEAHTKGDHGGGFLVCVRQTEGTVPPIWNELQSKEMEAHDFRCAVCDKAVRLHPNNLAPHLRPHAGMTRQAYGELQRNHPNATGFFNMLIKHKVAPIDEEETAEVEIDPSDF